MRSGNPTKILILMARAEDRMAMYHRLSRQRNLEVVAAVADPYQARDQIVWHRPHLLVMGLELPRMAGLEFLEVLNRFWPIPAVVISDRLKQHPELAVQLRARGTLALFHRPEEGVKELANQIANLAVNLPESPVRGTEYCPSEMVIAIGASTGGTVALRSILSQITAPMPPILIVQHMPPRFTPLLAASLNSICDLTVLEVTARQQLRQNAVFLAPGGRHLLLKRRADLLEVTLSDVEPVKNHRPSVDVLFHSVAETMGPRSIGLILTGMGADGADGLLAMSRAGAYTMAQDRASCVVYGMPREAVARGAVYASVSLAHIPSHLLATVQRLQQASIG